MTLHELLDKPVWQMTGEELLFLAQHGKMHDEGEVTIKSSAKEQKHFVYGLAGFARLFVVYPRLIASNKAEKSIEPSRKLVENHH